MVRIFKYITLLLFISFSYLKAENINNIIINGNKRISAETIKIYGDINANEIYSEKVANKILKNLYDTEFFENVEISFENNNLIINLKEYPILNQLVIIGEKSKRLEDEIKKIISSKENKPLNETN